MPLPHSWDVCAGKAKTIFVNPPWNNTFTPALGGTKGQLKGSLNVNIMSVVTTLRRNKTTNTCYVFIFCRCIYLNIQCMNPHDGWSNNWLQSCSSSFTRCRFRSPLWWKQQKGNTTYPSSRNNASSASVFMPFSWRRFLQRSKATPMYIRVLDLALSYTLFFTLTFLLRFLLLGNFLKSLCFAVFLISFSLPILNSVGGNYRLNGLKKTTRLGLRHFAYLLHIK